MRGEESIAVPDNTDSNVREVGIDDVLEMTWRIHESFHNGVDLWASANVLAELLPIVGNPCANRVGVADEGATCADTILLGV